MFGCVLGSDRSHRHIQVPADHFGHLPDGHALLGYGVESRSGGCIFEGQAEEVGHIEPVRGRPAV